PDPPWVPSGAAAPARQRPTTAAGDRRAARGGPTCIVVTAGRRSRSPRRAVTGWPRARRARRRTESRSTAPPRPTDGRQAVPHPRWSPAPATGRSRRPTEMTGVARAGAAGGPSEVAQRARGRQAYRQRGQDEDPPVPLERCQREEVLDPPTGEVGGQRGQADRRGQTFLRVAARGAQPRRR